MSRAGAGAVTLVLLLAACGFRPMYGGDAGRDVSATLEGISVAPIPDHLGQIVRHNLEDRLSPMGHAGTPQYRLAVSIHLEDEGVGILEDESITRINLRLSADYRLIDLKRREPVLEGAAQAFSGYDVVRSDYATLIARKDLEASLASQVAAQIHTRLAAHFRRQAERTSR